MARATTYTGEIAAEICDRMAAGEPLATMCRDSDRLPAVRTVYDWLAEPWARDFAARLARAREDGMAALAAECLEIADDATNDYVKRKRERKDGKEGAEYEAFDAEHVQRSKLRIETRLKLLAVWDPKRYGQATTVKHADADGKKLPPPEPVVRMVVVSSPQAAGAVMRNITPPVEIDGSMTDAEIERMNDDD